MSRLWHQVCARWRVGTLLLLATLAGMGLGASSASADRGVVRSGQRGASTPSPTRAATTAVPDCTPSQYSLRAYPAGGGMSHSAEIILLTHHGRTCFVRGYPALRLLSGTGSPLPTLATKTRTRITGSPVDTKAVELSGDERASFEVDYRFECEPPATR